jgi:hypothetical protein
MLSELPQIKNLGHLSLDEIRAEVDRGARFIVFAYTISFFISYRRLHSPVFFLIPGKWPIIYGYPYLLLSLIFGWWRFPLGPLYTLMDMFEAFRGKDFTHEVLYALETNTAVRIHLAS